MRNETKKLPLRALLHWFGVYRRVSLNAFAHAKLLITRRGSGMRPGIEDAPLRSVDRASNT
jgi:hypothetical protein